MSTPGKTDMRGKTKSFAYLLLCTILYRVTSGDKHRLEWSPVNSMLNGRMPSSGPNTTAHNPRTQMRHLFIFSHIPKTGGTSSSYIRLWHNFCLTLTHRTAQPTATKTGLHTLDVFAVGVELTKVFGASATCHLGNLLRVVTRHLRHQRTTIDVHMKTILTDNELLARWVGGVFDDFLSLLGPRERQPIKFLPPAQPFSRTRFFWAQHRDLSMTRLIHCLRPNMSVRTIVWVRDPVSRFFSSFYYAKYVRERSRIGHEYINI